MKQMPYLRWPWMSRGRGACPPKGHEEGCLSCTTVPGFTPCLTATREEWRRVRSEGVFISVLCWNRNKRLKKKKKKTYRISSHYFCRLDFEVTLDYLCVYLTNCSIYIFFSEWINRKDRFSEWSISFQLRECVHVQTVVSLLFGRFALSNVVFSLHLYLLHYSSNNLLKHSSVNSKQNKYMNNSKAAFLTSCKQLF